MIAPNKTRALLLLSLVVITGCSMQRTVERDEAVASASAWLDSEGRVVLTAEARALLGVDTVTARMDVAKLSSRRFGKVSARPSDEGLLVAPVVARVERTELELGAKVGEDELVTVLVPLVDAAARASLEAQSGELQGSLAGARANLEALEVEREQLEGLAASKLTTKAELARVEAELERERARAAGLRRARAALGRSFDGKLELRAPFAGIVASVDTVPGSVVTQGTVLARVLRAGPRWVDVAVPPGEPVASEYHVEVGADALEAELIAAGILVEPDGTRRDRLLVDEADSLLVGATVPVTLERAVPGIVLPADALVRHAGTNVVFVESAANHFEPRAVRLRARGDEVVVVEAGVEAGEQVVVRGASSLLGELGLGAPPSSTVADDGATR